MTAPLPPARFPLDLATCPGVEIPAAVLDFLAAETAALLVGPQEGREAARRRLQEVVRLAQIPLTAHRQVRQVEKPARPERGETP